MEENEGHEKKRRHDREKKGEHRRRGVARLLQVRKTDKKDIREKTSGERRG